MALPSPFFNPFSGSFPVRPSPPDLIAHPPHYTTHPSGVECITITEHMGFLLGNVMKYIWRCDGKGGLNDLKKARWYLEREIAKREAHAIATAQGDLFNSGLRE